MRSIFASAAILGRRYALVSALRTAGFSLGSFETGQPGPRDLFLVAEGEAAPAPARTVVIGEANGAPFCRPFRDGMPAKVSFGAEDAEVGTALVRALMAGPETPTAADPESLALFVLAERVAGADITVLINGPTGTGKEVLARTIHATSPRRDGPFVAINCAALPESMLEAMLFGHQKGAFTGASSGGEGFFRAANGGTLLLDEIAEMPLALQAKLLRALQEREVVPLGAVAPVPVDARVIACANRDIQAEVAAGRFRADLYYRLSVFPLSTKPLAERPADIAALAATMVLRHGGNRATVPWPTAATVELLRRHDWPGNVRELENVIQRALLFAGGEAIEPAHIVFDRPAASAPVAANESATLGQVVQMSEFAAIRDTLAACGGSRIETARRLGISERTLRYRLARAREQGEDFARPRRMSGVSGIGGVDRVMALRAQILERNAALSKANASAVASAQAPAEPASFASTFDQALKSVNETQNRASALSEQYERGETVDIAKVMLARQEASVGFEATLQVRNKLLSAYKDIMSMPV